MELLTRANNGNQDWFLGIYVNTNEDFNTFINDTECLKIILIKDGTGILRINNERKIFISPSLMILNEKDKLFLESSINLQASAIYFHPSTINSKLNFQNIVDRSGILTQTEIQDIALLGNFLKGYDNIEIDPRTYLHINEIFSSIYNQLKLQGDGYWPCRARSYLIELVILIERVFSKERIIDTSLKSLNSSSDANEILLYLHNNIQNKITILDISKELGINKNLIQTHVYNSTGLTTMNYLTKLRIQFACLLLRNTSMPINEIYLLCGFSDVTGFGRTFKKIVKLTPSSYRSFDK